MSLLILMRHGQSMWNAAKLFTGWVDVPLTNVGIDEAIQGGKEIAHLAIDEVHTSTLIRAQMTAMLALAQHNGGKTPVFQYSQPEGGVENVSQNEARMIQWAQINGDQDSDNVLPIFVSWQLNERMYGDLQGLNKDDTRQKDVPPPNGESLELTAQRTLPYLEQSIMPSLQSGKNVFVAAHGNSLRSIIMSLEGLSQEQVLSLEVPTGIPIVYEYSDNQWNRLQTF